MTRYQRVFLEDRLTRVIGPLVPILGLSSVLTIFLGYQLAGVPVGTPSARAGSYYIRFKGDGEVPITASQYTIVTRVNGLWTAEIVAGAIIGLSLAARFSFLVLSGKADALDESDP